MKRGAMALVLVVLVACGVAATMAGGYTADESVSREFTLDRPFAIVNRALRQPDTATEILNQAGASEFVDLEWEDTDLGFGGLELGADGRPKLDLKIERRGALRVRTLSEDIGQHVITLDQLVKADAQAIESRVALREGTDRLRGYEMLTRFEPAGDGDAGATRVSLSLRQQVHTRAPWFFSAIADRRVRESAEETLAAQEAAIRGVLEEVIARLAEQDAAEGGPPGPLKSLLRGLLRRAVDGRGG